MSPSFLVRYAQKERSQPEVIRKLIIPQIRPLFRFFLGLSTQRILGARIHHFTQENHSITPLRWDCRAAWLTFFRTNLLLRAHSPTLPFSNHNLTRRISNLCRAPPPSSHCAAFTSPRSGAKENAGPFRTRIHSSSTLSDNTTYLPDPIRANGVVNESVSPHSKLEL